MLYDAYEVQRSLLTSASKLAGLGAGWLSNPTNPFGYSSMISARSGGVTLADSDCAWAMDFNASVFASGVSGALMFGP